MNYLYNETKKGAPVFVMLHGTGGNETDLMPLAAQLNPDYNVLSVRGTVKERGMNRFFKRHAEGQYDLEDLQVRAQELYAFIVEKAANYDFKMEDVVLVGFSNGANIAIEMMLQEPQTFKRAALLAPMYPKEVDEQQDFSQTDIFLSLGKGDPIVSIAESERVVHLFESRGADVSTVWVHGHRLTPQAVTEAKNWLNKE